MEFEIYTDESYITGERYRSIAAFSYKAEYKDTIYNDLKILLKESGIKEFKWQKLAISGFPKRLFPCIYYRFRE